MQGSSTILGPDKLDQINQALAQAETAQNEIELAKRAGIDVSTQEQQLKESVDKLRTLKQVYFPNAP